MSSPSSSIGSSVTSFKSAERSHLRLDELHQLTQVSPGTMGGTFLVSHVNYSHLFLPVLDQGAGNSSHNRHSTSSEPTQNLAILSPFDEKEEWHKISEILNSFGTNIGTDVKESTTPNNCKY